MAGPKTEQNLDTQQARTEGSQKTQPRKTLVPRTVGGIFYHAIEEHEIVPLKLN